MGAKQYSFRKNSIFLGGLENRFFFEVKTSSKFWFHVRKGGGRGTLKLNDEIHVDFIRRDFTKKCEYYFLYLDQRDI